MPRRPRAAARMNQRALTFGSFEVRPAERVLVEDGRPVPLGARALDILVLLVERAGQVVGKDELIAQVWPSTVVEEATLRVHIAALRRHLHEGRAGQRYIVSVTGRGYSFVAPVQSIQPAGPAPAPQAAPGLPLPAVRLVGRDQTVAALAAKLRLRRFVTLVGPGGVGKTAVALQAAPAVAAEVEGTVFVDLAPVQQPALVPSALASALGLPARQDDPSGELAAHLAGRRLLLLLDSCEHVVDAVAQLTEGIFASAPQVHILATSREPLRCSGEWVTRLAPLDLPPANGPLTASEAAAWPAVQLFAERAAAAADSFQLDDANADRVAAICRHLDGMPLAIELAAARVDAFGLQGLQAMLDDPFSLLLASGRRGAQARHQTLHATLEWSYGLLSAPEQLLLRRVGIFAGRFALSALVAVACGQDLGAAEATYMVADLVDKSLLVADLDGERVRYRLLDTTRAYARDKLAAAGETQDIARRHAQHCLQTFQAARRELDSSNPADWLARYGALGRRGARGTGLGLCHPGRRAPGRRAGAGHRAAVGPADAGAREPGQHRACAGHAGRGARRRDGPGAVRRPRRHRQQCQHVEPADGLGLGARPRAGRTQRRPGAAAAIVVGPVGDGAEQGPLPRRAGSGAALLRRGRGLARPERRLRRRPAGGLPAALPGRPGRRAPPHRAHARRLPAARAADACVPLPVRPAHHRPHDAGQRAVGAGRARGRAGLRRGQRARCAGRRPCADAVQRAGQVLLPGGAAVRPHGPGAATTWSCCCSTRARTRCSCGTRSAAATRGWCSWRRAICKAAGTRCAWRWTNCRRRALPCRRPGCSRCWRWPMRRPARSSRG